MTSPPGPPAPYPPARVWSFPPPPVRRGWLWVAIAVSLASIAAIAAAIAVGATLGARDARGLIDDPQVLASIDDACTRMIDDVESSTPGPSRSEQVTTILDQNRSVLAMIDAVELVPDDVLEADRPTRAWLDDWRDLVAARADYADALQDAGGPPPSLDVPLDPDGEPITTRMDESLFEDVCRVPDVLTDPFSGGDTT